MRHNVSHKMKHANQITLRGLEPRLLSEVQRLARRSGVSMSRAALAILKKGAGINDSSDSNQIGAALDRFVGSWSRKEAHQFSKSIRSLEQIERVFWK
jgi:hypothetical protein